MDKNEWNSPQNIPAATEILSVILFFLGAQQSQSYSMISIKAKAILQTLTEKKLFDCWMKLRKFNIPSGKLPHNYGKIHHFQWVNALFLWSFSIAILT